jgi:hypothetical protein
MEIAMTHIGNNILNLIAVHSLPLSKKVAERLLTSGEFGLVIFGFVVAVGLIGEYISTKRRERWLPSSTRPKFWNWPVIWLSVVVIAVFSEFVCDAAVWEASDALQVIADHDIASEKAKTAALEKEATRLRADNLSLERIMLPRRWLDPSLRGAPTGQLLFDLMRKWSDVAKYRGTVVLISVVPDFEAQTLANDLRTGLLNQGWLPNIVPASQLKIDALWIKEGVEIISRAKWHPPMALPATSWSWRAGDALIAALKAEHVAASHVADNDLELAFHWKIENRLPTMIFEPNLSLPDNTVLILVGMKPGFSVLREKLGEAARKAQKPKKR